MHPSGLRVALFSGNYNYVRDGANQALNMLVGHLLARGARVRVYSPTTATPAFAPTGDLVSVPSFALPGERGEYRCAPTMGRRVRRDVETFAPNLVHLSAPDFLGQSAQRWARRHHIPVVASLHTRFETYPRYYNMPFLERPLIAMMRRFYQRSDAVVVPGESIAAILRDWGVTTPIGIWARGTDHARFSPARRDLAWRRALGIADDQVAIGFLGRLVLEKGLDVFADVARELSRRGVPHRIMAIGDGPARPWFAQRVPDAVFAGFQTGDDLGRAVAGMDVFFNPSVTETFGNVTLEAMAAGVPVVAARATGAVDLVDDGATGFLVPPRDVAAYADAIQRLIEDVPLRRAAGAAGRARAAGYVWDNVNEAVLDIYRRVTEAAATGRPQSADPKPRAG